MIKNAAFLTLFIAFPLFVIAQKPAKPALTLIRSNQTIRVPDAGSDSLATREVKLVFKVADASVRDTVHLQIISFNTLSKAQFVNGANGLSGQADIVIQPGNKTGDIIEKILLIRYHPVLSQSGNETAYIHIKNQDDYVRLEFDSRREVSNTIHLVGGITKIHPVLSDSAFTKDLAIKLGLFEGDGHALNEKDTILLLAIKPNKNSVDASVPYPGITISAADARKLNAGDTLSRIVYIRMKSVRSFDDMKDEFAVLQFHGDTSYHTLHITTKGMYNYTKPFWVEVGANLDLIDGIQANNFFTGVFVYKRDIRPFSFSGKKDNKPNNMALFAGVFESKTLSDVTGTDTSSSSLGKRLYFDRTSLALVHNDSTGVFVDSGIVKNIRTVRNIGLFFSPQVRLSNLSANSDGIHFFASLWIELQWQRIQFENNYKDMIRIDTIFVPAAQVARYAPSENTVEVDVRSHYFGLGAPMFYKDNYTNLFFNPVFGISNQPSAERLEYKMQNPNNMLDRCWHLFYLFQFRLNEERFGLSFTGEVRGLTLHGSPPFVTLALSKKFDLTKFLEFTR